MKVEKKSIVVDGQECPFGDPGANSLGNETPPAESCQIGFLVTHSRVIVEAPKIRLVEK